MRGLTLELRDNLFSGLLRRSACEGRSLAMIHSKFRLPQIFEPVRRRLLIQHLVFVALFCIWLTLEADGAARPVGVVGGEAMEVVEVRIEDHNGRLLRTGGGLLAPDGRLVTALELLRGCGRVFVAYEEGAVSELGECLGWDAQAGIALLAGVARPPRRSGIGVFDDGSHELSLTRRALRDGSGGSFLIVYPQFALVQTGREAARPAGGGSSPQVNLGEALFDAESGGIAGLVVGPSAISGELQFANSRSLTALLKTEGGTISPPWSAWVRARMPGSGDSDAVWSMVQAALRRESWQTAVDLLGSMIPPRLSVDSGGKGGKKDAPSRTWNQAIEDAGSALRLKRLLALKEATEGLSSEYFLRILEGDSSDSTRDAHQAARKQFVAARNRAYYGHFAVRVGDDTPLSCQLGLLLSMPEESGALDLARDLSKDLPGSAEVQVTLARVLLARPFDSEGALEGAREATRILESLVSVPDAADLGVFQKLRAAYGTRRSLEFSKWRSEESAVGSFDPPRNRYSLTNLARMQLAFRDDSAWGLGVLLNIDYRVLQPEDEVAPEVRVTLALRWVELCRDAPIRLLTLGEALADVGQYESAVTLLEPLASSFRSSVTLNYALASAYANLGKEDDATKLFESIEKVDPGVASDVRQMYNLDRIFSDL